jgi:hypothetical protein
MNNSIFYWLVGIAAVVLIGWVYFKVRPIAPPLVGKMVQVTSTPAPVGSNLGPPESITGVVGNGLEKGGVPSK